LVSGLGLSPFQALETNTVSKSQEKASSLKKPLFSKAEDAQDNTNPNSSSDVSKKSLNKKIEDTPFNQTLKKYNKKEDQSTKSNSDISNLPQMQILNVPNQYRPPVIKEEENTEVAEIGNAQKSVDLQKLPPQMQPVAKFLESMDEYFGIRPEKVMRALNQLPPDIMLKSPHEAMTPFFEKLELQPRDFTKAQIFFNEMIQDLEKVATEDGDKGQMAQVPSEIPNLSSAKKVVPQKTTLDSLIEQKIARKAIEPQNYISHTQQGENQTIPAVAASSLSDVFNVQPAQTEASGVAINKLAGMDPQLRVQEIKISPDKITEPFFVGPEDTVTQIQMKNILGQKTNHSEKDNAEDDFKDKLGDQDSKLLQQDIKVDNQFSQNLTHKIEGGLVPQLPTQIRNENLNKITENAQALITKGGGEMKVELRPEGLGDVILKVKVQDGQVGIQMITESHEAKKLLESGLNDLKLNLAEHKLSLHNMKVDVAAQADSNNMNNFNNQNMGREEARNFLNDFREYNQSMRRQFAGSDGVRAYMKSGTPSAPDINSTSTSTRRRNEGRLDLVA